MINPQSLTLIQAYEPYLSAERVLFVASDVQGFIPQDTPQDDLGEYFSMFMFDWEHKEVEVLCKGFTQVEHARAALFFALWNTSKSLRIGGVTDLIPQDDYDVLRGAMRP